MEPLKIIITTNENELNKCAELMCESEPFIKLKFSYEKCKLAVRGDYKEVYIASDGNEFVGFVVLQFFGVLRGYIQTICVNPEYRGKGIGTALLKFSEEKLLKQFPNVFMCVTSFNLRAQKLYYNLGYEKVGVLTNHIIQGADEYILRKQGWPTSEFKHKIEIIKTKTLSEKQFSQLNQMWNDEYPVKLKDRFPILLDGVNNFNHYIIEDINKNAVAWAVDFEKENEIRFSIIVDSKHKGKGLGSLLVERLKSENELFYGWVIDHNNDLKNNGEHYQTPMPFYLKHGFEILHDARIESEMIRAVKIKWSK